jgi:hypothetical protein
MHRTRLPDRPVSARFRLRGRFFILLATAFFAVVSPAFARSDVYVTDANNQRVYAYPAGVANPAPGISVVTPGIPGGITTDVAGNVYVTVNGGAPAIVEYGPGLTTVVATISGTQLGFESVRDVAIDRAGNLYVSCVSRTGPGVVVINSLHAIVGWYPAPTEQIYGVLVNPTGGFYLDTGLYGIILAYIPSSAYVISGINGAPSSGGLAFVGQNIVMTGGDGLWVFAPSRTRYRYDVQTVINFGDDHATGYPATAADGTLYVPVRGPSGGKSTIHEVRAYRTSSRPAHSPFDAFYTISQGLQEPMAVAVGPIDAAGRPHRSRY